MTEQERDGAAQRVRNAALEVAASHLEAVRGALVGSLGCGEKEIDAKLRDKATAEANELKSTRASLRAKEDDIKRMQRHADQLAETVQGLEKQLAANEFRLVLTGSQVSRQAHNLLVIIAPLLGKHTT